MARLHYFCSGGRRWPAANTWDQDTLGRACARAGPFGSYHLGPWRQWLVFSAPGGGWEYPAFLIVASLAQALIGDGAYALFPSSGTNAPALFASAQSKGARP